MSMDAPARRSVPFGTIILQAIACVLYVTMLANVRFSAGGGDAIVGEAIAELFLILLLWITLALLLLVSAVMGQMPRWAGFLSLFLVPFSGVAAVAAIDLCSRHSHLAIIFPVLLPLLITFYAAWARFPKLHAVLPEKDVSYVVWGSIAGLSVIAMFAASV
jgi:hypothetical protein